MKAAMVYPAGCSNLPESLDPNFQIAIALQKNGVDVTYFTMPEKTFYFYSKSLVHPKITFLAPFYIPLKFSAFLQKSHFIWRSIEPKPKDVYFEFPLSLLKEIKKSSPDIIHFRGFFFTNLLSIPLLKVLQLPHIVEPVDILHRQSFFRKTVTKAFLKMATNIFAWQGSELHFLVNECKISKEKIVQVPTNGFDEKKFYPLNKKSCRQKLGLDENYRYLLYVGGLCSRMGHLIDPFPLLHILKELNKDKKKFKLIIVGAGEISRYVNYAKKLGVDRDIIMEGIVKFSKMNTYYNAVDVLLWTFSEGGPGIGKTVNESMACGLPIVSYSNVFTLRDKDCILYVPEGDVKAMAKKVVEICENDTLRKELSRNSLRRAKECYTFSKIAQRVKREYEKILQS